MATKGRKPTKPSAPSGLTKEMAREDIKAMLNEAKANIQSVGVAESFGMTEPFAAVVYTHINNDETVDGELRIVNLPPDVPLREIVAMMAENRFEPMRDFWSSVGIRFGNPPDEDLKDKYARYRGMNQASTYFARMGVDRRRINYQFLTVQKIIENMENAERPRAMELYFRVHWNKGNQRPAKRYDRRVQED